MAGFSLTSPNVLGITIDPSLLSQPSSPGSAISPDIPFEPSSEEWPQDAIPEYIELHLSNTQTLETVQSAFPSPTTQVFDLDVQIRAHTQPPEDLHAETPLVDVRHPRDPRRSRRPRSPAEMPNLRQDRGDRRFRWTNRRPSHHQLSRSISSFEAHRPLSGHCNSTHRPPHLCFQRQQPPTSIPNSPPGAPLQIQEPWKMKTTFPSPMTPSLALKDTTPSDHPDLPIPPQRIPHTSFSLHLESQLAHLQHVISSMQTYLSQSHISPDEEDERATVENNRLFARNINRTLTELDEILMPLPRHSESTALERITPATAAEIRALTHTSIDPLLDSYDIAFTPTMFLWEKKAMYLRFIGAGRALMHRVLD